MQQDKGPLLTANSLSVVAYGKTVTDDQRIIDLTDNIELISVTHSINQPIAVVQVAYRIPLQRALAAAIGTYTDYLELYLQFNYKDYYSTNNVKRVYKFVLIPVHYELIPLQELGTYYAVKAASNTTASHIVEFSVYYIPSNALLLYDRDSYTYQWDTKSAKKNLWQIWLDYTQKLRNKLLQAVIQNSEIDKPDDELLQNIKYEQFFIPKVSTFYQAVSRFITAGWSQTPVFAGYDLNGFFLYSQARRLQKATTKEIGKTLMNKGFYIYPTKGTQISELPIFIDDFRILLQQLNQVRTGNINEYVLHTDSRCLTFDTYKLNFNDISIAKKLLGSDKNVFNYDPITKNPLLIRDYRIYTGLSLDKQTLTDDSAYIASILSSFYQFGQQQVQLYLKLHSYTDLLLDIARIYKYPIKIQLQAIDSNSIVAQQLNQVLQKLSGIYYVNGYQLTIARSAGALNTIDWKFAADFILGKQTT